MDKPYLGAFDIKTYLDHHHIRYWETGKNVSYGWIAIQCPWCDDHLNHLGINLNSKSINCFRCTVSGTVIKLVMKFDNIGFDTACQIIKNYSSFSQLSHKNYSELLAEREKLDQEALRKPKLDIIEHYKFKKEMQKFHRDFLISRRYDPDDLKIYDLYFGRPIGDFALRIIIPISFQKQVVSFVARDATGKSNVPYVNCPNKIAHMDIKDTLYGIDSCKNDTVLVVEGILDKWRIGDDTVATYGDKYTSAQVELLRNYRRIFVLFDTEKNAQENAQNLCNDLNGFVSEVIRLELDRGDPDDLDENDVKHFRKQIFKKIY